MHPTLTTLSKRLDIVELPHAAATRSFGEDVANGLSSASKHLSPKYFYDELGSVLFDAITKLPEYYLTAAETEILREWGWEIVRALDGPIELLELGSGSAIKTRVLIGEAIRAQGSLRYSPIDISKDALQASAVSLIALYAQLAIHAYAGDYFAVLASPALTRGNRVLALVLGSNIGNYTESDARTLLGLLGKALRPGDGVLLGTDLKKDRATLELAYDDPTGVTAAFNKNLLARINRELGGTFDLRTFDHVVEYDEASGTVESFLRSQIAQTVEIAALGLHVCFEPGERIHTESSHKFTADEIAQLAHAGGFRLKQTWRDARERFAVNLLVREG